MLIKNQKTITSIWCLLLFTMLFMPRIYQPFKLAIMSMLLIFIAMNKIIRISFYQKMFLVSYMIYFSLAVFMGIVSSNEIDGIISFIRLNFVYIMLFFIMSCAINNNGIVSLLKIILISAIAVGIYSVMLFFVQIGVWPENLFWEIGEAGVGIHEGYTHLTNTNISCYLFVGPFVGILAIEGFAHNTISRKLICSTEMIVLLVGLMSGRRIVWGAIILPFAWVLVKNFASKNLKTFFRLVEMILLFIIIFQFMEKGGWLNINALLERFLRAFGNDYGMEFNIRSEQIKYLWEGFLQYPILGKGAGGILQFYARNSKPWLYETTYNYILYQSGIIGMVFYITALASIPLGLIKKRKFLLKNEQILLDAVLCGYIMCIMANATNPYFSSSFDFYWMIFIPFAFLNYNFKERNSNDRGYSDESGTV